MATIRTLEELAREAEAFLARLVPSTDGATLVTLSGDLGAGKTAFVKEVAKLLGITEDITSPTFVLEKIYALPQNAAYRHLIHIDAYRLENPAELASLGFDELMQDSGNLVMFEWPERGHGILPIPSAGILLALAGDGTRILDVVYQR